MASARRPSGPKKVFIYSSFTNYFDKYYLDDKVTKLGGKSQLREDMYISECTHVVVPNFWKSPDEENGTGKWTSMIVGAIGSGKFVVRADFINDSYEENAWKNEEDYIPPSILTLRSAFMLRDKLYTNQNILILVDNILRLTELRNIIKDGGGNVFRWVCRDLALKRNDETFKIDVIYTDMSDAVLKNPDFLDYVRRRDLAGRSVKIRSFYCIFNVIKMYPGESERAEIEANFDVINEANMLKFHPLISRRSKFVFYFFENITINSIQYFLNVSLIFCRQVRQ